MNEGKKEVWGMILKVLVAVLTGIASVQQVAWLRLAFTDC